MMRPHKQGECQRTGCNAPARYDVRIQKGPNYTTHQSCQDRWHLGVIISGQFEYLDATEIVITLVKDMK